MTMLSTAVIQFSTIKTAFATVLVALSTQGVCTVLLGDTPAELVADLQCRQPNAQLIQDDQALTLYLKQVTDFLDSPHTPLDFPLDIQGSDFQ